MVGRVQYRVVQCGVTMCTGGVSCTHVWSSGAQSWSYLVAHEGKMGKVSIRRAGQCRTAGGVNTVNTPNQPQ